jgi:hypothetical protein
MTFFPSRVAGSQAEQPAPPKPGSACRASRPPGIRMLPLYLASQQMKKTKAELALFVLKGFPNRLLPRAVKRVAPLPSNKTGAHA